MPAPNDLTPEEERMFVEHGVQPAGPGREPVSDGDGAAQQGDVTEGGQSVHQPQQHSDREPPQQTAAEALAAQQQEQQVQQQEPDREALRQQVNPKRENGQFKSKEEIETEVDQLIAGQQQQQQAPPPGFVPLAALHEARNRERQFAQQLSLAQTRMNALLSARAPQEQGLQLPDLNENPVAYVAALGERLEQLENQRIAEAQNRQIDNALEQDEHAFAAVVPDYEEASDYFAKSRAQELLNFYPPQQAHEILVKEARNIAQQAWQRGIPAAQAVYQLAQARGYQPQNTAANPVQHPLQGFPPQQGQQQVPRGPTPQAQIQAVQKVQQNGPRSLSGGAGGGNRTEALNANALLNMSDEEFEQYLGLGTKGASARFAAIG